jgi:predicted 3-demethylubiquinone-9 3-methyltransferase (glyoxalase superfamily)
LYYFEEQSEVGANNFTGMVPLENLSVAAAGGTGQEGKRRHVFAITNTADGQRVKGVKKGSNGRIEQSFHESYLMQAKDDAEMNGWISSIRAVGCRISIDLAHPRCSNVVLAPRGFASAFMVEGWLEYNQTASFDGKAPKHMI